MSEEAVNLRDFLDTKVKDIVKLILELEEHKIKTPNTPNTQEDAIDSLIDECKKEINRQNEDYTMKETEKKSNRKRSSIKKDQVGTVAKRKSIKKKLASLPVEVRLSRFDNEILNPCYICCVHKRIRCIKSHVNYENILDQDFKTVLVSFQDNWIIVPIPGMRNVQISEPINCFSFMETSEVNQMIYQNRQGIIVLDSILTKEDNPANIKREFNITSTGTQYNKKILPNNKDPRPEAEQYYCKQNIKKKTITDTCVITECEMDDPSKVIRFFEPNSQEILNQCCPLSGKKLMVVKNAFIIIRKILVKEYKVVEGRKKDEKVYESLKTDEFVEPCYVRFDVKADKSKEKEAKEPSQEKKDGPNVLRLMYCFYPEKGSKFDPETGETVNTDCVRLILIRVDELYQVVRMLAEKFSMIDKGTSDTGEPPDEKLSYKCRDRHTAVKIRIDPVTQKMADVKEYQNPQSTFEMAKSLLLIREDPNGFVRYRSKIPDKSKKNESKLQTVYSKLFTMLGINGSYILTNTTLERFESRIIFGEESEVKITETIFGPNMDVFCQKILEKLDLKTQDKDSLKALLDKDYFEPLERLDYYVRVNYSIDNVLSNGEYDNEETGSFLVYEVNRLTEGKTSDKLTVSNLKPSKKDESSLMETKGCYELDNEVIKVYNEKAIKTLVSETETGLRTEKDILKTVVFDDFGDCIVDLEQKTEFVKDKKTLFKSIKSAKVADNVAKSLIPCDRTLILDSFTLEETPSTVVKTRISVESEDYGLMIRVTEPNILTIFLYRAQQGKVDISKQCSSRYCEPLKISKYIAPDNKNVSITVPNNKSQGHKCVFQKFGNFGILSKYEIIKLNVEEGYVNEEVVETRYEAKLIQIQCNECDFGRIAILNRDMYSDACNFTQFHSKLSMYDFCLALDILKKSVIRFKIDAIIEKSQSRFKHRIQRALFAR